MVEQTEAPAVESLWAFTLKSALPYLEKQLWDPVPDLPHPSAAKPASLELEDHRWCDPCSDVEPFPDTSPPSPRTPGPPGPPSLSSSQQDLPGQTKPAPKAPDRRLSAHSRPSPDQQTAAPQHVHSNTQQREEEEEQEEEEEAAASSAGQTCVKGKQTEETASGSGMILTQRMKMSTSSGPPAVKVARTDGGGGGEAGLQKCPMCLQVFPAGFTQMDCDGHLAQCLSEMNVDMTW